MDVPIVDSDNNSKTISELVPKQVPEKFKQFIKYIDYDRHIPLSNLDKNDARYLENYIDSILSLYIASEEISKEEYLTMKMVYASMIAKIKRGVEGFERQMLQKQISESIEKNKPKKNIMTKLFGGNQE